MTPHDGVGGAGPGDGASNGNAAGIGMVLRDATVDPVPLVLGRPGARAVVAGWARLEPASMDPGSKTGTAAGLVPMEARALEDSFRSGYSKCQAEQRAAHEKLAASIRRGAFEQGMEEGRRRGLEEGREEARITAEREAHSIQEFVAVRMARLDRLLAALSEEMQRCLASGEEEMVALCHAVVCRILGEQLVTRQGVAQCVRQAIQEAGAGQKLRGSVPARVSVHVHPRDLAALESDEELAAWMHQQAGNGGRAQWVPDAEVTPGGCIVRSSEGSLDARIETQMAALRQLLLQARPGAAAPERSPAASIQENSPGASP